MAEKVNAPGFLGFFSFSWVTRPIFDARKNKELLVDNFYLPKDQFANPVFDDFQREWDRQAKAKKGRGRLLSVLLRIYGRQFFIGGIFKLLWSMFVIIGAFYFVRSLLLHINPKETDHPYTASWTGWVLSTGFFAASLAWSFCLQRMGYICMTSGIKVRAALITAVTRKAIFLSSVDVDTSSDIVNFVANDIGKVYDGMQELHYIWAAPLEAATILALLASMVKVWALPGVGTVTLILLSQYVFGLKTASNKYKQYKLINARNGIMTEVLPAMKLVKYYGWEKFFEDKVTSFRDKENKLTFWNSCMKVFNVCLVFSTPPATALVIFGSYEFTVNRLNSTVTFITLTLFNILRFPLVVLPKALRAASEAGAALAKLEEFLLAENEHEEKGHDKNGRGIDIRDAVFQYDQGFQLNVPEFHCNPGEVVAVVGRVGAGKTALLQALLGGMQMKKGSCRIGGRIAYVPQTAWVQNLSIKDNIVFGNEFNEGKYREVIHACALELDLQILPQGDQSMGGLRGMNLSGGQRQRVNIARSAYFEADTVLLDNALSAVDHHTADHIFEHCIKGLFAEKAVVLVTHQLQFMRRCDKVAIFDSGDLKYFGAFNPTCQNILSNYLPIPNDDTGNNHDQEKKEKKKKTGGQAALAKPEAKPVTKLPMGRSTTRYLNAGPAWKFIAAVLLGTLSQSIRQMSDFWIRFWTNDEYNFYEEYGTENGGQASQINVMTYGILVAAFFWFQVFRSGMFYYWNYGASNAMHAKKLRRVLNTPLGFFLVKPVGELLNTFSSDQDKADESLPDVVHMALIYSLILLSTSVTVSINIPEFAAFAAILVIVTGIMLYLYLPAATQIKKMRLETAGGLVGTTAEVLEGLTLIQAYNHEQYFVQEFTDRTDQHHRAFFTAECLNLWISFYCDGYGAVMLYAVGLFAVWQKSRGPAIVGLAFSNTIQLLVFYTWTLRLITEAISLSASIEQLTWLSHHTPVDGEDDINNEGKRLVSAVSGKDLKEIVNNIAAQEKVNVGWPQNGEIAFENVRMRYRPTAAFALNGVNLTISHGEKVGIVGRTGSGKSTLLLALYRMFDLASGRITVSGVDIHSLPLQRERRGLSIIPQEPFMFTGTLRENLDPLNQYKDADLLRMIDVVGLHDQAAQCGGLDGHVAGSGSGAWSLGQQQLVCLIRAALNKVPIVCMDEATAALDPHTEKHVLEVAGKLFAERTVLTIAHRLDAVIESDTVVVMEQGKVAETGAPHRLLSDPASWFSKLIDMSGPAEASILRATAAKHFANRGH